MAAIRRKRITLSGSTLDSDTNSCSTSTAVEKGHFVVYSADKKRFVLPLEYLRNEIVMELFNLAEEEFGLPGNGLLILPCDATFMEYVIALIKRKPSSTLDSDTNSCSTSTAVEKGHFVVYSADKKRFVLPLEYLRNEIVMELFNLAEEEFGLPGNGLLILPCDATFMEYVIALIKRKPSKDVEKALILSVASSRCSSSNLYQLETSQQLPIWSF
ncbi:hypothetical protein GOBAR_AA11916 [Gossypium barbadense]|uniref:Uncharacterized protein n=1 Tax=Gossypium barbadense TaxID=3634 RepID=A0A2P5XZG8_GOSBA|nr:hypothetical protein GOBAR_AA11916 [Gossypium barbadense]